MAEEIKYIGKPAVARQVRQNAAKKNDPYRSLKIALWSYFLLLIFEGALRKWVLPFLATPLLLVRDPIVIWAMYKANKLGILPKSNYISTSVVIGVISIFTAVLFGHGNILVALFGARTFLFYLPFIFLIGRVFNKNDVIEIGRATLWIALPMTVLVTAQFYSPQSAWVNRAVGGDEGGGFSGAMGYFRPPGTFSFTNGVSLFYTFLSCYVFYFWLNQKLINRIVLLAATFCLVASIPLSISRALLFSICVVALFVVLASARKPKYIGKVIAASVGLFLLLMILSKLSFFQTATEAFTHRFESAGNSEGGLEGTLVDRYLGDIITPLSSALDAPIFGFGIGLLTNVGSKLTTGIITSGIAEGEVGRMIAEMGLILGIIALIIRTSLSIKTFKMAYSKLATGEVLPWTLLSVSLLLGPQGNWAQPTSLGFSVLTIGLVIAATNEPRKVVAKKPQPVSTV
ncbi:MULTISPECIES: hypothetical protein [unclassified Mucilaginibacter]|uniref:hypothetical protein n=1 Tax=unclassified Mucilaginibacter TaxID=2617802 RepID=UPI0031F6D1A4